MPEALGLCTHLPVGIPPSGKENSGPADPSEGKEKRKADSSFLPGQPLWLTLGNRIQGETALPPGARQKQK
jgi:hypothetical protein